MNLEYIDMYWVFPFRHFLFWVHVKALSISGSIRQELPVSRSTQDLTCTHTQVSSFWGLGGKLVPPYWISSWLQIHKQEGPHHALPLTEKVESPPLKAFTADLPIDPGLTIQVFPLSTVLFMNPVCAGWRLRNYNDTFVNWAKLVIGRNSLLFIPCHCISVTDINIRVCKSSLESKGLGLKCFAFKSNIIIIIII